MVCVAKASLQVRPSQTSVFAKVNRSSIRAVPRRTVTKALSDVNVVVGGKRQTEEFQIDRRMLF